MHRYFSTDGLTCQLKLYRLQSDVPPDEGKIQRERHFRNRAFRLSTWTIWGGAVLLAFGAVCLAIAFGLVMWKV